MKTIKILFISFLAIVLMSFQCEAEEPTTQNDCDCVTTYYTLPVGANNFQWYNTEEDVNNELDCEDAMENIMYTGTGNMFYQVTCE